MEKQWMKIAICIHETTDESIEKRREKKKQTRPYRCVTRELKILQKKIDFLM